MRAIGAWNGRALKLAGSSGDFELKCCGEQRALAWVISLPKGLGNPYPDCSLYHIFTLN